MRKEIGYSSDLFSELQKHLPGVFFKGNFDGKYNFHYISENSFSLIGYTPEELIKQGITLADLVHPDDREELQKKHKEQIENNLPVVNEFRVVCRNGEIKWLKEITSYYRDAETGHFMLEGYALDITFQKTGVSIADAYLSYQNAVNSGSLVSITDKKGNIIFANDNFIGISKYSRQELIGANHNIINSGFHSKEFFAAMWKDILEGKIWRGQLRNRAKDGSIYWVDTTISPITGKDGKIQQFLSIRNVITEQKEREYSLMESEALNRSVLVSLNASIAIIEESGNIEKVNDNWKRFAMQGGDHKFLNSETGSNIFGKLNDLSASGDQASQLIYEGIQQVLKGEKEVFEFEYPCPDAEKEKWVLVHVSKFENDIKRLVLSHFDISERKIQEKAIRMSEARMVEAQRLAKIGSWELDVSSNMLVWSEENYRIFEKENTGEPVTYDMFLETVHPDDREYVNKVYTESVKTKTPYNIVHRLLFKDGRVKYINEQCVTYYDKEGKPVRSVGTSQDITQQKESEILVENQRIRYENVVENISDGLIIDAIDGKVVFANKQFMDMIGISEEDLATFVFDDFVADEYKEIIRNRHIQRMKGEEVSSVFEYVGLRKDGSRRWFEARVTKILHDKKIIGTQSAIRDITDQKQSIDLLKASEAEKTNLLHELNQRYNELMQFNYIVSHNLRAPIANIMGLAEMFNMDGIDEEEKRQIINHIQFSILKIDELINDLNIILAARSDIHSKKEKIVFSDIIERVEKTLDKQIRESKTRLKLKIEKDAETIYSIKSFIKSTLYNLVNNAIKYRDPKRNPVISIGIKRIEDKIEIKVEDNGIGIDLEKYGKDIFGLYKRFHPSFEGKGLGLNMTKTQVESLGGTISIESNPGKGSVFTVLLPINERKRISTEEK